MKHSCRNSIRSTAKSEYWLGSKLWLVLFQLRIFVISSAQLSSSILEDAMHSIEQKEKEAQSCLTLMLCATEKQVLQSLCFPGPMGKLTHATLDRTFWCFETLDGTLIPQFDCGSILRVAFNFLDCGPRKVYSVCPYWQTTKSKRESCPVSHSIVIFLTVLL